MPATSPVPCFQLACSMQYDGLRVDIKEFELFWMIFLGPAVHACRRAFRDASVAEQACILHLLCCICRCIVSASVETHGTMVVARLECCWHPRLRLLPGPVHSLLDPLSSLVLLSSLFADLLVYK